MSESNVYQLGEEIPITGKGEIEIWQDGVLKQTLNIKFTLSPEQKRKWIIVSALSPIILSCVFILSVFIFVNLIVLITPLSFSIQTEKSSNMVNLRWSYKNKSATFDIERQVKTDENQWAKIGHPAIKEDNYVYIDNDVEPNTKYQYKISAKVWPSWIHWLVFWKSKTTSSDEVLTLPSKPQIVTAKSPSDSQVVLRWKQPNGAEWFEISRGENQADLEPLEIDLKQIRQENEQYVYTDQEALTPNTRYRYALVAWNQSGPSEQTEPISALTRPSQPTDLKLEDIENDENRVKLSWSSSDSGNGLGFGVYGSPTEDGRYTEIPNLRHEPQQDRQSFVHAIAREIQWYRVVAYNESGDSQPATLEPQPIVKQVEPNQGPENGNTPITISGTGFVAEDLNVTIGGNDATNVVFVNPLLIRATTPQGNGRQDVVVSTSHDRTFTLQGGFTYQEPNWATIEIPQAGAFPPNATVEITVDRVIYSLRETKQQVGLKKKPPVILIKNEKGCEFKPFKEAPTFYQNGTKFYIGYIELRYGKNYSPESTVQIYSGNVDITWPHPVPDCNPIILLLKYQPETTITVKVKNKVGEIIDSLNAIPICPDEPWIKGDQWQQ